MAKIKDNYLTIGTIGAAHGIKGWLKIHSYTETVSDILNYQPWHLSKDKQLWIPMTIESSKFHHQQLLVKLPHIDTPEQARCYTGYVIAITRDQLPKLQEGEYYWSDLIGLSVYNQHNQFLGNVIYLIATGSNDALVIKKDQETEFAIPFLLKQTILAIDLKKGMMHVNWEAI